MPYYRPPRGITPPAPGLEHEEPTFVPEEDIPDQGRGERAEAAEDRPPRSSERE